MSPPTPRVAAYEVHELLSESAEGSVWRARDPAGRMVALKLHDLAAGGEIAAAEMALLDVRHPGLAACLDANRIPVDGRLYTASEFVEGRPLAPGRLAAGPGAMAAAVRLLAATGFLHDHGRLHRDIKPDNVWIEAATGAPVLLDFGLSCTVEEAADRPLAGTPRSMAPELLAGAPPSRASDLWAVGLVLAEAVLGRPIFHGADPVAMEDERRTFPGLTAAQAAAIGEPDLARLLDRLLSPDPARRPADAHEAIAALRAADPAVLAEADAAALEGRLSAALSRHDPRRRARLAALAAGASWVAPFPESDTSMGDGLARLVALCAGVEAPGERLAARRTAATATGGPAAPADLAALVEALAEEASLVVDVGVAGADARLRPGRQQVAQLLAGVRGVRVWDEPRLEPEEDVAPLRDWLGAQPVLEARLATAGLRTRGEVAEALAALVRCGAVAQGAEGVAVAESALAAAWPVAGEGEIEGLLAGRPRDLLGVLALSPRPLAASDLAGVLQRDVSAELAALAAEGLARRERSRPEDVWAPVDGRLRRLLLAAAPVPSDQRVRLARRVAGGSGPAAAAGMADVLGAEVPETPDDAALSEVMAAGAEELRRVGRLERAVALARRGAAGAVPGTDVERRLNLDLIDLLIRRADYDEALEVAGRARGLRPRDAAFIQREARVLVLRGRAGDALQRLADLDPDGLPDEDAALVLETRSDARDKLGLRVEALRDMREALRRRGATPERHAMVMRARLGLIEEKLGHHEEAMRQLEAAIAMARQLGQEALVGPMLSNLGRIVRVRGERRRGLGIQEDAARRMELAGNTLGLAHALNGLGIGWMELGRVDTARRHLGRALVLAERLGEAGLQSVVHNNMGRALSAEGRHDQAEGSFARSLELRADRDDVRGQAIVHVTRGHWRLKRGRLGAARADLLRARDLLSRVHEAEYGVKSTLQLARLALAQDDRAAAQQLAGTALEQAREIGHREEQLVARALLARVGADDLEDVEPEREERGAQLAELLCVRAVGREAAGRRAQADADFELALTILGESPDGPVEAEALIARVDVDLGRLAAELEPPATDFAAVGELLARISRDSDRAAVLIEMLDLAPLRERLDALRARQARMEHEGDDMTALSRLAERVRDLERLAEINKALNSVHDTQQLLDLIVDSAIEMTGAARGFLILFQGDAQEFRAARNIDESTIHNPEFEVSHSVARQAMRSKQPLITANAIDDPRLASARSISELKLLSILCVPLVSKDRGIGAIYLDHPQVVGRFREDHLEMVTSLAEQAAIALENARLQEGLSGSNAELRRSQEEINRLNEALQTRLQKREAELEQVRESLEASRRALELKYDYSQIVTRSPAMHAVLDLMDRVIDTDYPVIIQGESGTGKELIARAIHFNGPRKQANFVSLNCAAIPEHLIESELFGHVRGAFTGADRDRKGLFEQAHGGTLFLDEIGDMSIDVQKRLLRVLQEGTFLAVGGREERRVDVRVLCATHRDLQAMVSAGTFREDLYYRLAVAQIRLPPLRERTEDIPLLVNHFVDQSEGRPRTLEPEALALLERRPWPGNVRELGNFVMNLLMFDPEGRSIGADLVRRVPGGSAGADGDGGAGPGADRPAEAESLKARMEAFERRQVLLALEQSGGNKAAAARRLGVGTRSFYKMLARLGLS